MSLRSAHSSAYLISHWRLLWRVTRNEWRGRYAGSLLGVGWSLVGPALILAIYAAVYLLIFKVSVPGLSAMGYVLFIFSGLVPFLMGAEAISVSVSSVTTNKAILSNTVFPIDLAPLKAVMLSQPPMLVGFSVTIAGLATSGHLRWTALLALPVWLLQVVGLMGLAWILSLVNVVLRDLQNLTAAALMGVLVISPIAYTPAMVPHALAPLLLVNPFAYFVIAYQRTLAFGQPLVLQEWAVLMIIAGALFGFGGWFFARTKLVLVDYV